MDCLETAHRRMAVKVVLSRISDAARIVVGIGKIVPVRRVVGPIGRLAAVGPTAVNRWRGPG
jgi:hypothetical protein